MASSDPKAIKTATRIVRRDGAAARQIGVDLCVVGAGIADGILRDLGSQGALHYRHGGPSNTIVVQYDEIALARWIEREVQAAGITVLLGAVMRTVTRDGRRIRAPD